MPARMQKSHYYCADVYAKYEGDSVDSLNFFRVIIRTWRSALIQQQSKAGVESLRIFVFILMNCAVREGI